MLTDSIANLNTKFDKFNDTISGKINQIENNYNEMSMKIDSIREK